MSRADLERIAGVSSLDGAVGVTDAKGVTVVYDDADQAGAAWKGRTSGLVYRRGAFVETSPAPPTTGAPEPPKAAPETRTRRKKKGSSRRSRSRPTDGTQEQRDES
jgi:hypothetical protein